MKSSAGTSSPNQLLLFIHGHWIAASIATAVFHSVFTHIEKGCRKYQNIAKKAGLNQRGTRALLDSLVGIGVLIYKNGNYYNSREASEYLIENKPLFLGNLSTSLFLSGGVLNMWTMLPKVCGSRKNPLNNAKMPVRFDRYQYKHDLIVGIEPMTIQAARETADFLNFSKRGPVSLLDIGGGSGIFSATLLQKNSRAQAIQVDFPSVNKIAKKKAKEMGVSCQFKTVNGRFEDTTLPANGFDFVIYSNYAHSVSRNENLRNLRQIRRLLTKEGTLIFNDYIIDDHSMGKNPLVSLAGLNWLLLTRGNPIQKSMLTKWLFETGFKKIRFKQTDFITTLALAK